jgi:hypothetical protein
VSFDQQVFKQKNFTEKQTCIFVFMQNDKLQFMLAAIELSKKECNTMMVVLLVVLL